MLQKRDFQVEGGKPPEIIAVRPQPQTHIIPLSRIKTPRRTNQIAQQTKYPG